MPVRRASPGGQAGECLGRSGSTGGRRDDGSGPAPRPRGLVPGRPLARRKWLPRRPSGSGVPAVQAV